MSLPPSQSWIQQHSNFQLKEIIQISDQANELSSSEKMSLPNLKIHNKEMLGKNLKIFKQARTITILKV